MIDYVHDTNIHTKMLYNSNNDEVYSQSNADIYSKNHNTILLNDRQKNRQ